jgi:uncharacterized Rmd1/YagE family protein
MEKSQCNELIIDILITATQVAEKDSENNISDFLSDAVALFRYFTSDIKTYPFEYEFDILSKYVHTQEIKNSVIITVSETHDKNLMIPHMSLISDFEQRLSQTMQSTQPFPRNIKFKFLDRALINAHIQQRTKQKLQ